MPDRDAIRKYVQAKAHKRKKASPLESMERAIESAMASALDPASLYRPRAKDDAELESALEALDRVERDAELEPRHVGALEAIVNPTDRPVYDVVDGTFTPAGLYAHLSAHVATLERCIAGVGRVEPDNPQIPYAGTAFLAAPTILLTNRHVARLFAEGVGEIRFTPFVTTQLDLKRERDRQDRLTLRIVSVPLVHPYWDLAALEVEGVPDTIAPLALAPEARGSEDVVVIGYPYLDARNPDRALQDRIFDGVYGVKRLQPGELTGTRVIRSFDHDVEALTHDASTLGGNSGSAVVDAASGIVLGIHFAGLYLDANFAVPAWELYRDPRVRALSLHWSSPPSPPAARPEVDRAWQGAVRTELDVPSHAAAAGTQVETLGDWYERTDDETLARELARDRAGTIAKLAPVVGERDAREIATDLLDDTTEEGLFSRAIDPSLPEIVFLHGIMGGHLVDYGAAASRVWINPFAILLGRVSARLTLAADGVTDAGSTSRIQPGGHVRLFYAKAARKWRKQGFVVHEHAFDWRKGIAHAADRLHHQLETLRIDRPSARFAIVAHSMGGLVASVYAARHPNEAARIGRAIFLGSPLGGSFAPLEAVLGTYPFLRKLALVARDRIEDLQKMAVTLPGLLEMLPDPELFPDCAPLYARTTWPEGLRPQLAWLDSARQIKTTIRTSPLLPRTTLLVCTTRGTVGSLTQSPLTAGKRNRRGDGTVPARAALVPGLPAYEIDSEHSQLPANDRAIEAVAQLLREGSVPPDLKAPDPTDLGAEIPGAETIEELAIDEGAIAERMRSKLTRADLEWLFAP